MRCRRCHFLNKITFCKSDSGHETAFCFFASAYPALLNSRIKFRGITHIFSASCTKRTICVIKVPGLFFKSVTDFTARIKKMRKPVIVALIFIDSVHNDFRRLYSEIVFDYLFSAVNEPCKNILTGIFKQIITVIFLYPFSA